jgi:hypothetical protein
MGCRYDAEREWLNGYRANGQDRQVIRLIIFRYSGIDRLNTWELQLDSASTFDKMKSRYYPSVGGHEAGSRM